MHLTPDVVRAHFDYSAWASEKLVEAAGVLAPEELTRDFRTADRSVLDTLVHIFAADRLWLSRLSGSPHPGFITGRDRSLEVVRTEWPELHRGWQDWASTQTIDSISAPLTYTDMKGREWTQPIWQLAMHVVNHATHHRGQVSGFLRSMGHTPPGIDLAYYYREGHAAKRASA